MFQYRKIISSKDIIERKPTLAEIEKKTTYFRDSITVSQIFKKIIFCLIILIIILWLTTGIKEIIFPPYLTVTQPMDNFVTEENLIKIVGQTEKEAQVLINNQLVSYNTEGHFEETVSLNPGLNLIRISVFGKNNQERVVWKRIMMKQRNSTEF